MRQQVNKRDEAETATHSIPSVIVQVPDIGYGTPGIEIFCNKLSHKDCQDELNKALRLGGRIIPRTDAWRELAKRLRID